MDNPLATLRLMVLLVLVGPLVAAALVCALGRFGPGAVRRTAALFALAHLGLTLLLALLVADQLNQRASHRSQTMRATHTFEPIAVPGDPGHGTEGDDGGQVHETAWSLLSLGAPKAGLAAPDIQFFLGLDGLNVWLVLLTSLMTLVAVWVSWGGVNERVGAYYGWLFVLETGILGAFLSFDVILFYVFFELTLIPAFFLIGQWGVGGNRREAARKFFLYTLFGSLLTLAGVVGVVVTNPTPYVGFTGPSGAKFYQPAYEGGFSTDDKKFIPAQIDGPITFAIPRLMRNVSAWAKFYGKKAHDAEAATKDAERKLTAARARPNDLAGAKAVEVAQAELNRAKEKQDEAEAERDYRTNLQVWLFLAMMAGFAVKTPIVPFHTWLPAAYSEAPMAVTMLLSALLAKLGTFGMLRVVVPLAPDAAFLYGLPVFGFLGGVGIVYAALCAYAQRDAKLLVAYSSVSHLGLLVLGLFALNHEGVSGAVLHMVNHGISVGAMFALLGFLYDRYRTLDMNQYGGLIGRFPGYAVLFFTIALAGIGLPGLNNFVSEMLLMAGLFDPVHVQSMGYGLPVVAAFGVFLSSWYVITMLRRIFFGPTHEPAPADGEAKGMTGREVLAFGVPAVLCIVLGVYPQPILDTIRDDAGAVVNVVNAARVRANYPPISAEPTPVIRSAPQPPSPKR